MRKILSALLIFSFLSAATLNPPRINIESDENLHYFPTYIFYNAKVNLFHIKVHAWAYEPESDSIARSALISILRKTAGLSDEDLSGKIFTQRMMQITVDQESRKSVSAQIGNSYYNIGVTDQNGHTEREIVLPPEIFYPIIGHNDNNGIPTEASVDFMTADKTGTRIFKGTADLIKPSGVMILSDIDDTIKISNVNDTKALLRTAFTENFKPVPDIRNIFSSWKNQGADFIYLTATPWQLHQSISAFLEKENYPKGVLFMKSFGAKDSYSSILDSPVKFKTPIIQTIMRDFPAKKFILIGDSSEKDSEIYADTARKNPGKISHIFIRNVAGNDSEKQRILSVFTGLDPALITVFTNADEIKGLPL